MHSLLSIATLFAAGSLASPAAYQPRNNDLSCLDDAAADRVANNFASLISAYTTADANAYLTQDVHDYSDSVITLIDSGCPSTAPVGSPLPFVPLGSATFDSRSAFEQGQGGQPNITTFTILNVWHSCTETILRWRTPMPNPYQGAPGSVPGAPPINAQEQVTGIIVLETEYNLYPGVEGCSEEPFLIKTVYSEFNSGAWLYDLGVFKPGNCAAS